jgi:hypothetical protein
MTARFTSSARCPEGGCGRGSTWARETPSFRSSGAAFPGACSPRTSTGAEEIELRCADLLDAARGGAPWPLVTFNAPLPASDDHALIDRFWRQVRDVVAEDAEVIVHSQQPLRDYPACLDLPGSATAVRYTPEGSAPAFGVTIWRRADEARRQLIALELTSAQPHVRREDFGPKW